MELSRKVKKKKKKNLPVFLESESSEYLREKEQDYPP